MLGLMFWWSDSPKCVGPLATAVERRLRRSCAWEGPGGDLGRDRVSDLGAQGTDATRIGFRSRCAREGIAGDRRMPVLVPVGVDGQQQ